MVKGPANIFRDSPRAASGHLCRSARERDHPSRRGAGKHRRRRPADEGTVRKTSSSPGIRANLGVGAESQAHRRYRRRSRSRRRILAPSPTNRSLQAPCSACRASRSSGLPAPMIPSHFSRRALGGHCSRAQPGPFGIQWPRHLQRELVARPLVAGHLARTARRYRYLQEPDRRPDRGRHRRNGQPAHTRALRSGRAADLDLDQEYLWRHCEEIDA